MSKALLECDCRLNEQGSCCCQGVIRPCLDLESLKGKQLEDVVEKARDWAQMHGACLRRRDHPDPNYIHFAPFLLLPSTFPRKEFEKAVALQTHLNELVHRVAYDDEFLTTTLKSAIEVDDFTARLFKIYETVRDEGFAQPIDLGLFRADYMYHYPCQCCYQVEVNTMASSFAAISVIVGDLQRFVLTELGKLHMLKNLPENRALEGLCRGMLKAWELYQNPEAVIMFLVEDVTYNICDQRFHEFEIQRQNPKVKVIRKNLTEIAERGKLGPNKQLIIDGHEVAVIYMRSGYSPEQYHTEKEWDARLLMERSRAIKSPSIHYHLAGTKKVQQELARPNVLERFIKDPKKVAALRDVFTGLYSLDVGKEGDETVKMAYNKPERFVLKPQREGGGNNLYGQEMIPTLDEVGGTSERTAYILMERILPPTQLNYMVRPESGCNLVDVVGELGIFGVVIGDKDRIIVNEQVGHTLRTKVSTANEGGVAAGLGALDSPYLA